MVTTEPTLYERWKSGADIRSADMKTQITHLGGVPWWEAPLPKRRHKCWTQTDGWLNYFDHVERCACGAIRSHGSGWDERNSRKEDR